MSTAIMQTGAMGWDYKFHDWNDSNDVADIQLKDQYSFTSIHQQQTIGSSRNAQNMRINGNVLHGGSDALLLQNQIAVIQQQQQQQKMLHNALTRTVSHQATSSDLQIMSSNIEAISPTECHRKLERTQSEPAPQVNQQVNTSRYKTELCRPFKETGECKYGEKCQFAHGENELRTVQRHPKYKTEYCRTFYGVGLCPYGSRCHFLHDLSDDDNARAQNARALSHRENANRQNGYNHRNITSAEVDAITKAARFIGGQVKDEQMAIVSPTTQTNGGHRTFGRSASVMNTNAIGTVGHPLPMSPPLSMSTGSDRASPICSLSPTNSIASFPFNDSGSSTFSVNNLAFASSSLHITPPASPPASMLSSSAITPPPTPILNNNNTITSTSTTTVAIAITKTNATTEKSRLPIFNQIASNIDQIMSL